MQIATLPTSTTQPLTLTTTDSLLLTDGGGTLGVSLDTINKKDWHITGNAGTTPSNFLGTTDNVSLRFRTNNTEKMIIDSTGNVGIGISTPTSDLHIYNAGGLTPILSLETVGGIINRHWKVFDESAFGSFNIQDASAAFNRLRIDTMGNVTVGTSLSALHVGSFASNTNRFLSVSHPTGTSILELAGTKTVSGDNVGAIQFINSSNTNGTANNANGSDVARIRTVVATSNSNASFDSGGDMIFETKPEAGVLAEKMRITSNGNVGIGTTNPTDKLEVHGVIGIVSPLPSTKTYIGRGVDVTNGWVAEGVPDASTISVNAMDFAIGGWKKTTGTWGWGGWMFINSDNGYIGIGTVTPSEKLHVIGNILASGTITSSDVRYKKEITPLTNSSELINKLNPVSYYFRKDEFQEGQFDDKLHFGVIAQEIEKVLPNVVYTDDSTGYKAVNYTDLIPILISSNQEQQVIIEAQENKIQKMEEENALLKEENKAIKARLEAIEKMLLESKNK